MTCYMGSLEDEDLQKLVDAAWKSEGLPLMLKEIGDPRWSVLEEAQMIILAYEPEQYELNSNHKKYLKEAYNVIMELCGDYNYDSGKRKFNALPIDGLLEPDKSYIMALKEDWINNPGNFDKLIKETNRYHILFKGVSKIIYP